MYYDSSYSNRRIQSPKSEADKVHLDLALLGIVSTTVPDR